MNVLKKTLILLFVISLASCADASHDGYYIKLGNNRFLKKNYDQALVYYNIALEHNSNNAEALYGIGLVYLEKNDLDNAIHFFTKSIDADSENVHFYQKRAEAWFLMNNFDKARKDLEKALAIDADHLVSLNNYAWLLATCPLETVRDGNIALKYSKLLVEKSSDPVYLDTLAAAYAEVGDYDNAIKTQKELLKLTEKNHVLLKEYENHLTSYLAKKPLWQ